MTTSHIAIIGSRTWPSPADITEYVKRLPRGTVIVSGGAVGADTIAVDAATKYGLPEPVIHWPDRNRYGTGAYFERNKLIVQTADKVVAFAAKDGKTKQITAGTAMTIDLARRADVPVEIIETPVPPKLCETISRLRARFHAITSAPTDGHRQARIKSAQLLVRELITERETRRVWLSEAWDELDAMPAGAKKDANEDAYLKRLRVYEVVCDSIAEAGAVFGD